ncbi:unnamed protein product [Lymnaea stagnalis]|uniref:Glycine cleavage system H protein n=1 Tax=Lymnaea stagnalis TaxID=6523 RepID=A0AAV2HFD9_LYMST
MAASVVRKLVVGVSSKIKLSTRSTVSVTAQIRSISFSRCLLDRLYTDKHEWVTIEKGKGTVGISEYAQEQLGEIVFVELPEVGAKLEPHDVAGCLESVKAASEVYSPVGGTVTEVNKRLSGEPKLVNSAPLTDGWLYKLDLGPNTKSEDLLDEKAYKALIGSLDTN